MSTRLYPLYRRGNPQLRVFLPNFWMKLVQPDKHKLPPNRLQFVVSSEMSSLDVKNYLEKIYSVPVMAVRTVNASGRTHEHANYRFLYKDDDFKLAFVTLPLDHEFTFPDVVKLAEVEATEEKSVKEVEEAENQFKKASQVKKQRGRQGLPSFFGL